MHRSPSMPGLIYLSGTGSKSLARLADRMPVGLMLQPKSRLERKREAFRWFAIDNGCFAAGDRFNLNSYLAWLATLPRSALFATAPDVLGDALATLHRSEAPLRAIRGLGFKAALVAQNGLEELPVPWKSFDCLFLGGDTRWKLGRAAALLAIEAKQRGKWVHMGRVNSQRRLRHAIGIGCDSVDGNFLLRAPDANVPRLARWFRQRHLNLGAAA
jgi:hypothetical protein